MKWPFADAFRTARKTNAKRSAIPAGLAFALSLIAVPGIAQTTQVNLSSLVNWDLVTLYTDGTNYPQAGGALDIGAVPFVLSTIAPAGHTGVLQGSDVPGVAQTFTIPIGVHDVTTVYTIMNSRYGNCGVQIGELDFVGASSATYVYPLTEGTNLRDHHTGGFCNTAPGIAGTAIYNGAAVRFDMQQINLPASFASDTLVRVIFKSYGLGEAGAAFIAGMTVTTAPVSSPNIYTYAGTGTAGATGDGGLAIHALLNGPTAVGLDASANLYIADTLNQKIRKVQPATNYIGTPAGDGVAGFTGDFGPATYAELSSPSGVATDALGNIYFADKSNQRVRELTLATGIITTVAGDGTAGDSGDGGSALNAELNGPFGVALDAAGNVYIAELTGQRIRMVASGTGIITTVAGTGVAGYSGDQGQAISARLNNPKSVAVDAAGNLYIADSSNQRIRLVAASTGVISTVAGVGTASYSGDGLLAVGAGLNQPVSVTLDSTGNLYIADRGNNRIRMVTTATGIITTVAGYGAAGYAGDGGPAIDAELNAPSGVAVDAHGEIYIADDGNNRVRIVGPFATAPGVLTQTALACSPTAILVGQSATLSASVTGADGGTPTGSLTFNNGSTLLATASLGSSGTASSTFTPTAAGTYTLTATYGGSAAYLSSASPSCTVTVASPATSTTLTAAASTLVVGQTLGLTATVSGTSTAPPTGTVTFQSASGALGTSPINASGVASLILTLPIGTYSITATYSGDTNNPPSTSSIVVVTVTPIGTTTLTLGASSIALTFGQTLSLTATASGSIAGHAPTGTVSFSNHAATLGASTLNSAEVAAYSFIPSVGTYLVDASYPGDPFNSPATAPPLSVTVNPAPTTLLLSSSANPATFGSSIVFSITSRSSAGTPSGSVTLVDATTVLGILPLNANGAASFSTASLAPGTHSLTAIYMANGNFAAATALLSQLVVLPPSFSISASAPMTLITQHHGPVTIAVTPMNGFSGTVTLSCGTVPAYITCEWADPELPETALSITSGSASTQLVIDTSAVLGYVSQSHPGATSSRLALAGLLSPALLLFVRRKRRLTSILLCCIAAVALLGSSGCSTLYPNSTPPGAYSIPILGTSGSLHASGTLTLIVTK